MNFSSPLVSSTGCVWSGDGRRMVTVSVPRVTLWSADKCQVVAVYPCQELSSVDKVMFSPDGQLVLVAGFKQELVLVFSVSDLEWRAKIEAGAGGLTGVSWGCDSRHILTLADWSTMLTVWSLSSNSVQYVKNPKSWSTSRTLHNRDGCYSFIVERRECRDWINIFTGDWQLVRQVELDTEDCAGAEWSSSSDMIVVWDSCLYYRVQVVSVDGRIVWDYSAYDHQLGVRSCCWSPDGRLLSVGSYDNRIRIFSTQFWSLVNDVDHAAALHEADPVSCHAVVYNEDSVETDDLDIETRLAVEMGGVVLKQTRYVTVEDRPVYLDFTKPDSKKAGSVKVGVSVMKWSSDGRYIASKCDNLPTTVWIWDIVKVQLISLLVHSDHVRDLAWDPHLPRCALVTGGGSVYIWSPLGALVSRIPSVVRGEVEGVTEVRWGGQSRDLALSNRKHVVLCQLTAETRDHRPEDDTDLDLEPSRDETST